jgi:ribosomal protein L15
MRAGFEGGQMPLYMRIGKQRGATSKDAMPIGPHRTHTVPVNVAALEATFASGDEVTLEALIDKGLVKNSRTDVKILGQGSLTKKLSVTVHAFSSSARKKIESAGGTALALRPPVEKKPRRVRPRPVADAEPEDAETPADRDVEPEANGGDEAATDTVDEG